MRTAKSEMREMICNSVQVYNCVCPFSIELYFLHAHFRLNRKFACPFAHTAHSEAAKCNDKQQAKWLAKENDHVKS